MHRIIGLCPYERGLLERIMAEGVDVDAVVARFRRRISGHGFLWVLERQVERKRALGRVRTAEAYASALASFRRFRAGVDVMVDEVTGALVEEYAAWLTGRGVTLNTVSFYMRILRAVYRRAVEEGLCADSHPFRRVYTGVAPTPKRAIGLEEVRRIAGLDLRERPHLEQARDVFMLLFYCRGMSLVDAAFLRKTDVQGEYLVYRRKKTGQSIAVRWEDEMAGIVARHSSAGSPYLLNLLREDAGDVRRQYRNVLARINHNLKQVGRLAGVSAPLTGYVSRHAWASIAYASHVSTAVIGEALGHRSEATTRIYLASLSTAEVDRANADILRSLRTP